MFHVLSGYGRSARESVLRWHEQLLEVDPVVNDLAQRFTELRLLDNLDSFPFDVLRQEVSDIMSHHTCDVLILGGGMVGLSLANQFLERGITESIIVIDKEAELGRP